MSRLPSHWTKTYWAGQWDKRPATTDGFSSIGRFRFSRRTENALNKAGVFSLAQLIEFIDRGLVTQTRGLGKKAQEEIRVTLESRGILFNRNSLHPPHVRRAQTEESYLEVKLLWTDGTEMSPWLDESGIPLSEPEVDKK